MTDRRREEECRAIIRSGVDAPKLANDRISAILEGIFDLDLQVATGVVVGRRLFVL